MASSTYTTPAAHSLAAGPWAASARSATDTVKDGVKLQYGGVCWLCENPYPSLIQVQVAHNVDPSIEATVAHRWQAMGILPGDFYPAHPGNLMPLCITCHHAYDDPYPIWVALPEDLDLFIEFERNDYEARVQAAAGGVPQPRSLPPIDPNGTLCRVYFFRHVNNYFPGMNWSLFPKPFRGIPQTLILKALRGCHFPIVREPIADDHGNTIDAGMPTKVRNQVNKLMQLWSHPDPTLQKATRSKRKQNTDNDDNEGAGDDNNGGKKGPGSRDSNRGKEPLSKAQRFSTRPQKQQLGSKTEYAQPGPSKAVSADGVRSWLDHVEDLEPIQATTPISPSESERLKQEEMEQQPGEHKDGRSAAASSHHADQEANMTGHWVLGPRKTAADVMSEPGSLQRIRDREFIALQARQAALEKERRNQH